MAADLNVRSIRRIRPDGSGWHEAVTLKRERAYSLTVLDTGLNEAAIDSIYKRDAQIDRLPFHDAMLRRELADKAELLLFIEDDSVRGYACLSEPDLIGAVPIVVVTDVCFSLGLNKEERSAWCTMLIHEARASGRLLQITCDGDDSDDFRVRGGKLRKATLQFLAQNTEPM